MSEQVIDLLGWMPMTERLSASLRRAFAGVSAAGGSSVETEHLLAAFLEDVDANVYLAGCNVRRERLRDFCRDAVGEAAMPSPALETNNGGGNGQGAPRSAVVGGETETIAVGREGGYYFARENRAAAPAAAPAQPAHAAPGQGGALYDARPRGVGYPESFGPASAGVAPAPAAYPAAAASRSRAVPGPSLRRLMARASEMAERDGVDRVTSELALQAIVIDDAGDSARQMRQLLPEREVRRLRAAYGSGFGASVQPAAQPEPKRMRAVEAQEPAFAALCKRIESLVMTLHRELQKDVRYRIVNDLTSFVSAREPDGADLRQGADLQSSALPILQATRQELERDPQYLAMERMRAALRSVKMEEAQARAALAELMRHGHLEPNGPFTKIAQALIELPSADEAPATALDGDAAAALPVSTPAPLPPQAAPEAEPRRPTATPILSRVLDTVRPASQMFGRRRGGAAETGAANGPAE